LGLKAEILYAEGFEKSNIYSEEELRNIILDIGIFKFKGYSKAFRKEVLTENIDDILKLYYADRSISSKLFELSSKIEIKLKYI
jgi:abortive infection bacteriophage resistance protein